MSDDPDFPADDLEETLQNGPRPMPRKTAGEDSSVSPGGAGLDATIVGPGAGPGAAPSGGPNAPDIDGSGLEATIANGATGAGATGGGATGGDFDQDPLEATMVQGDDDDFEPTVGDASPAAAGNDGRRTSGLPKHLPTIPDVSIKAVLGTGGQGAVYRGHQEYLERQVAVKILHRQVDPSFSQRFQREAKILAGLLHPNIVVCHQAGVTDDDHCYMVMEFIDGPDLHQEVRKNGPLDEPEALSVLMDIAQALSHGNESAIIHRDVKPQNVLLQGCTTSTGNGQRFRAKLADLGLARCMDDGTDMPELTAQGAVMGTPSTMAPEQFDNPDEVDHRTDIYGLGCVLFFAVTGKPAFEGGTLTDIYRRKTQRPLSDVIDRASSVSEGTRALLRSMLAPAAADRPQTYETLIEAIGQAASGQTPPSIARQEAGPKGRLPLLVGGGVLAAGLLAFALLSGGEEPTDPETDGSASPTIDVDTAEGKGKPAEGQGTPLGPENQPTPEVGPDPGATANPGTEAEEAPEGETADEPTPSSTPSSAPGLAGGKTGIEASIAAIPPRAPLGTGVTFEPFSVWSKGPEMFDGWVLTNTQRFGGEEDTLTRVIGRRSGDEPRQSASRSVPSGSWSLKGSIAAWESMTSGPSYQGGLEFMASSGASLRIQVEQPPAGGTGSPSPHVSAAWRGADGELGPLQVSLDVPLGIPGDEYATEVSFVLEVRGSALTLSVNEGEARDVSPAKGTGTALRSMTLYCANGTTRWRDFVFTGL